VTFKTIDKLPSVGAVSTLEKPMFSGEVLLCEDNPANQEVASLHLAMVGLEVTLAENGRQGLDIMEERMRSGERFDLILMDIYMPVLDGIETTKKLIEMGVKTPIIAVTANILPEDKEKYVSVGMTDFLSKPFKQRDLWECLMKYLVPVKMDATSSAAPATNSQEKVLDMLLGIENSANNEDSYKKILYNFLENQWKVYEQIKAVAGNKDFKEAHMTAHKEKNVAAIIGAVKLTEILNELEKVFGTDTVDYPHELMGMYEIELNKVLMFISELKDKGY
jgi:CheY-like chemotaxis protein